MFTDTHTHPYLSDNDKDFVSRAIAAGVSTMIMPNVDLDTIAPMYKLADTFPDNLHLAMGLHPTEVKENANEVLEQIDNEFNGNRKFVAVGEVGIDLYWDDSFRNLQMEVFDRQLCWAKDRNMPVIIHCREGLNETLEVLQYYPGLRAVFHSFGGSTADVERILTSNGDFYFGINGIVTFKNSTLRDVIPAIPTDRILLETDSPYLAPVPYRGRPNESAYIPFIADAVSKALGKSITEVGHLTTANAARFFNLSTNNDAIGN